MALAKTTLVSGGDHTQRNGMLTYQRLEGSELLQLVWVEAETQDSGDLGPTLMFHVKHRSGV